MAQAQLHEPLQPIDNDAFEREYQEWLSEKPRCSSECLFSTTYFLRNLDRLGLAFKPQRNFSTIYLSGHPRNIRQPPRDSSPNPSEDARDSVARQIYATIDARSQTRLVKLYPGEFDAKIVCELITHDYIDVGRKYEALSYTWGKPLFTAVIDCNGIDYSVTQNLSDALRFIRQKVTARWLWIDAICINQSDLEEKSKHIQNMYQIYNNAQTTLIWLGLANEKDDVLLDQLRVVARATDTSLVGWHRGTCAEVMLQMYDSLRRFLGRPWFKRSWVRQEVAASRNCTVLCGDISVAFDAFDRGVRRFFAVNVLLARDLSSIRLHTEHQAVHFARLLQQRADLDTAYERACAKANLVAHSDQYVAAYICREWLRLVLQGFVFLATDMRDKIFSMGWALEGSIPAGAAGDPSYGSKIQSEFLADYTLPISIVNHNFIKAMINRSRTLEPLSFFRAYRVDSIERLPGWGIDMKRGEGGCLASGSPADVGLAEKQSLSDEFVPLHLRGTIIGRVRKQLAFEGDLLDLSRVQLDDIEGLDLFSTEKAKHVNLEKLWDTGEPMDHLICSTHGYCFFELEVSNRAAGHLDLDAKRGLVCASDQVKYGALIICAYGGYHPIALNEEPAFMTEDGQILHVFTGPAVVWIELGTPSSVMAQEDSPTDRVARSIGWKRWKPDPKRMNQRTLGEEKEFYLI